MGEVAKWVALSSVPNLGPRRIATVYRQLGSIDSFFSKDAAIIADILNLKIDTIKAMLNAVDLQQAFSQVTDCKRKGIGVITPGCPQYHDLLAEICDPPPVLYYKGVLPVASRLLLGVVGSRKATRYGRMVTNRLVPQLVACGLGIVSGLAMGIDCYAHWAALNSGGYTLAVLGNGVDVCYPPSNSELQRTILNKGGCLLSEFPPGTRPRADHFPRRNRVISGLTKGLVVVEAGLKSGAMITVGLALEQGRDVFALPGNIDSPQSKGTNYLIKMGAKPVLSSEDVLEEFGLDLPLARTAETAATVDSEDNAVYSFIDEQGITVDELCYLTGLPGSVVLARLVALELKGRIQRLPGQKYVRSSTEV